MSDLSLASQRFPAYLRYELTSYLQTLSLDAISFTPGEFTPLLNSRQLLLGVSNLTSLTLKNIPDFPRIILASCPELQKLDIENVHILDDASRTIPVQRAQLAALECRKIDKHTFAQLVSVVDVTRLMSLTCELTWGSTPEGRDEHQTGMQHVLYLCRSSLRSLQLISRLALQSPNKHEAMVICSLFHLVALTELSFVAHFSPESDHLYPHLPQKLVIDEVLATLSKNLSVLTTVYHRVYVGIDQALKRATPSGELRLDNTEPLSFFRHPAWHGLDWTLAGLARDHPIRVRVDIKGEMAPETRAVYDNFINIADSRAMGCLMEQWGRNVFLEFMKASRSVVDVSASVMYSPRPARR